jgi:hypothetical protein
MARGRILSTNVARDPELNSLSTEALLLYLMAVPHLDRDGLVDGDPTLLWALVAPRQTSLLPKAPALIDEWVNVGLVIRYAWKDGAVLFFKGFPRHNANMTYKREPPSRFPAPPSFVRTHIGLVPDDGATAARWAESVNPKSEYYRALADVGAEFMLSAGGLQEEYNDAGAGVHAKYMQSSRGLHVQSDERTCNPRDEVEVEDQHDVVADHALPAPRIGRGMGGVGGGFSQADGAIPTNGHVSAGDIQFAFTDEQLRSAAYQLGSVVGLHAEWTGYERYLARQPTGVLVVLLEWIQFYSEMPLAGLEKIQSLTAVIRTNINNGSRAPLTGVQRRALAEAIEHAVNMVEEI